MELINYPLSLNEEIHSPDILRTRREQLGVTQCRVAQSSGLPLIHYQRLERGERTIENASMKTGLSICAVLKLDPFLFLPEAENRNRSV